MKKLVLIALLSTFVHAAFALFPVREYKQLPTKFGMKYEEVRIPTSDAEVELNSWLFESPTPTFNWVIISHSGDGNMADNLERVNSFLSAGYNVLIYDYRGYGSSTDFTIENDMYIYPQFIIDLNSVCDWIKGAKKINRFDLYGIGIGAGLSIGVGANRPETKHVVADAPWTSLQTMEKKMLNATGKAVTMPFAFDKNYEPEFAFEKPTPHLKGILAIVADKDPVLGSKDFKAVKGISSVYVVKGCEQNPQNFATDKNLYFQKVVEFMNN